MNMAKTGLIAAFSAVLNPIAAVLMFTRLENFPGIVRLLAVVVSGLATGISQGFFIGRPWHGAIGIGTFVGALILWSPVVVVTYGFALFWLPLLGAFAIVVYFGAKLGSNLRVRACRAG
jgi:hypothetical protein